MRFSIRPLLPRRQAFLFLVAILVPCLVLVALGLRTMEQERQLEDQRHTEERQRLVAQMRQELLSLLEKIKLQQVTRAAARGGREDSSGKRQEAVVLVGALVDGRLQLPWEDNPKAQKFREWVNEASFALALLLLLSAAQAAERGSIPLGLDAFMPVPEHNSLTPKKVALGRKLFFDRRLSRDGSIACSSCHDPERAFSDGHAIAVGVSGRHGRRNASALINRGYGRSFFWTLSEAAARVNLSPVEIPELIGSAG